MKNFAEKYNDCIDELNDAKLIIRELKMKLRDENLKKFEHAFIYHRK